MPQEPSHCIHFRKLLSKRTTLGIGSYTDSRLSEPALWLDPLGECHLEVLTTHLESEPLLRLILNTARYRQAPERYLFGSFQDDLKAKFLCEMLPRN
jgi:hypothetical protein